MEREYNRWRTMEVGVNIRRRKESGSGYPQRFFDEKLKKPYVLTKANQGKTQSRVAYNANHTSNHQRHCKMDQKGTRW